MSVTGVSANLAPLIQSALNIDKQLDTSAAAAWQRAKVDRLMPASARKAASPLRLNAQLAALSSYDDTITNVGTTISLQQSGAAADRQRRQHRSGGDRAAAVFAIDSTGQTTAQKTAQDQLSQIFSVLNTQGGNGYLFSGSAVNQPAVDTADHILNGNGAQAGLEQVIAERKQADLGADGLGRLVIPPASGSIVSVSEDAAGSPFGLKLAAVNSTLTGATVTGPTGSPASISVDLGATNPNNGDTITFTFALPDGTSADLAASGHDLDDARRQPVHHRRDAGGDRGQPAGGADRRRQPDRRTSLSAASAMAASNDFFDDPPLRVAGPPATATSLSRRHHGQHRLLVHRRQRVRLDPRIEPPRASTRRRRVSYGTQANEQAHPLDRAERRGAGGDHAIRKRPECIGELRRAQSDASMRRSRARRRAEYRRHRGEPRQCARRDERRAKPHQQTANTLTDMLQSIEGVDTTQVGAQILSLQTSLSASLSTTARMSQINLLDLSRASHGLIAALFNLTIGNLRRRRNAGSPTSTACCASRRRCLRLMLISVPSPSGCGSLVNLDGAVDHEHAEAGDVLADIGRQRIVIARHRRRERTSRACG